MDGVNKTAVAELGQQAVKIDSEETAGAARERVRRLLHARLTPEAAVEIALLNNKGLQAAYNDLGIAEARFIAATLPPSPRVSSLVLAGPSFLELEPSVAANLLALLTLPARAEIAEQRFQGAQLKAAQATLRLAAETRRAYFRAVADVRIVGLVEQARVAAETTAELAKQLRETGALSKLDQAREEAFHADVTAQVAQARLRQTSSRERLTRLMGLSGPDISYRLPAALPPLPQHLRSVRAVEVAAVARRIDLRIAGLELDALAKELGLTNATRLVSMLDLAGVARYERTESETIRGAGFQADVQIPIFDLGETRVREAQETYMRAVNRLAEKAVNIRSEARESYHRYRASYDIARQYQTKVLPQRKVISEEMQLRASGMLVDPFQLLTETRARIDSNIAAIAAQRDFFIAATDLSAALSGGGRMATENDSEAQTPTTAGASDK